MPQNNKSTQLIKENYTEAKEARKPGRPRKRDNNSEYKSQLKVSPTQEATKLPDPKKSKTYMLSWIKKTENT